ncbi:hypothetical protein QTA45_26735, partial [Escherichia coli]|nr:hypothetical protein [Escherichia coli]
IKSILEKGLDKQPVQDPKPDLLSTMEHENVRGSEYYRKRKLTAVCSHQTRIGNLDAHLI